MVFSSEDRIILRQKAEKRQQAAALQKSESDNKRVFSNVK